MTKITVKYTFVIQQNSAIVNYDSGTCSCNPATIITQNPTGSVEGFAEGTYSSHHD